MAQHATVTVMRLCALGVSVGLGAMLLAGVVVPDHRRTDSLDVAAFGTPNGRLLTAVAYLAVGLTLLGLALLADRSPLLLGRAVSVTASAAGVLVVALAVWGWASGPTDSTANIGTAGGLFRLALWYAFLLCIAAIPLISWWGTRQVQSRGGYATLSLGLGLVTAVAFGLAVLAETDRFSPLAGSVGVWQRLVWVVSLAWVAITIIGGERSARSQALKLAH